MTLLSWDIPLISFNGSLWDVLLRCSKWLLGRGLIASQWSWDADWSSESNEPAPLSLRHCDPELCSIEKRFLWCNFGTLLPPGVQLLPNFEVWSYRAWQPLQMWQISHFCEMHSLSYEASKFFAMLSLCGFFGRYFAPGANIVPPIAYKSHSTPFPIRPHVLTPHSWLCDKNCGRSSAPKKSGIWKWRITLMLPCHIWQAPLIIIIKCICVIKLFMWCGVYIYIYIYMCVCVCVIINKKIIL